MNIRTGRKVYFRSPYMRSMQPAAAAASWWLSGGISAANAIAAYGPKGAASQAASYVNLSNPGTYDAAPGTAPAWATGTGWTFTATSSQYLTTGLTPDPTLTQTWTWIVKFASVANTGYLLGTINATPNRFFSIIPNGAAGNLQYGNVQVQNNLGSGVTSGVLCAAGRNTYLNAVPGALIGALTGGVAWQQLYIGARNQMGVTSSYISAAISSLAIYNTIITPAQVAAVTAAMP